MHLLLCITSQKLYSTWDYWHLPPCISSALKPWALIPFKAPQLWNCSDLVLFQCKILVGVHLLQCSSNPLKALYGSLVGAVSADWGSKWTSAVHCIGPVDTAGKLPLIQWPWLVWDRRKMGPRPPASQPLCFLLSALSGVMHTAQCARLEELHASLLQLIDFFINLPFNCGFWKMGFNQCDHVVRELLFQRSILKTNFQTQNLTIPISTGLER